MLTYIQQKILNRIGNVKLRLCPTNGIVPE